MKDFTRLLPAFDEFLSRKGLHFEAVVIGGAAMQLLGLTTRTTKDCDVLTPEIPVALKEAAGEFASRHGLAAEWFNNGPRSLIRDLPQDWREHLVELYRGRALVIRTLCRLDFIRSKLFAFVDRGIDIDDLEKLNPTHQEIEKVIPWLKERDGNPDWPAYVELQLQALRRRLDGNT